MKYRFMREDLEDKYGLLQLQDKILEIAQKAEEIMTVEVCELKQAGRVKLAVARDESFCFYYQDNLELLQRMGAELVFFPLCMIRHFLMK